MSLSFYEVFVCLLLSLIYYWSQCVLLQESLSFQAFSDLLWINTCYQSWRLFFFKDLWIIFFPSCFLSENLRVLLDIFCACILRYFRIFKARLLVYPPYRPWTLLKNFGRQNMLNVRVFSFTVSWILFSNFLFELFIELLGLLLSFCK